MQQHASPYGFQNASAEWVERAPSPLKYIAHQAPAFYLRLRHLHPVFLIFGNILVGFRGVLLDYCPTYLSDIVVSRKKATLAMELLRGVVACGADYSRQRDETGHCQIIRTNRSSGVSAPNCAWLAAQLRLPLRFNDVAGGKPLRWSAGRSVSLGKRLSELAMNRHLAAQAGRSLASSSQKSSLRQWPLSLHLDRSGGYSVDRGSAVCLLRSIWCFKTCEGCNLHRHCRASICWPKECGR